MAVIVRIAGPRDLNNEVCVSKRQTMEEGVYVVGLPDSVEEPTSGRQSNSPGNRLTQSRSGARRKSGVEEPHLLGAGGRHSPEISLESLHGGELFDFRDNLIASIGRKVFASTLCESHMDKL